MKSLTMNAELPILWDEETGKLYLNTEVLKTCRTCAYSQKKLNRMLKTSWSCGNSLVKKGKSAFHVKPEDRLGCKHYYYEALNENIYKEDGIQ